MSFKKDDKVRVVANMTMHSHCAGKTGKVVEVFAEAGTYRVNLEWEAPENSGFDKMGVLGSFFESELELVDEKREALIELAETLDSARKQANAISIPVIESQRGVYGQIELSLLDTLEAYFEGQVDDTSLFANATLNSMIDSGNSVREALKAVVKNDYNEQGNR